MDTNSFIWGMVTVLEILITGISIWALFKLNQVARRLEDLERYTANEVNRIETRNDQDVQSLNNTFSQDIRNIKSEMDSRFDKIAAKLKPN
jgi:hypothetical protein